MSKTFGNVNPADLLRGENEGQAEKNERAVSPQNEESGNVQNLHVTKNEPNNDKSAYKTVSVEKKTRKTLIVLPPSLHEKAKNLADEMGISFNEFACQALSEKIDRAKSPNTADYKG